jgi:hypothetical protein
MRPNRRILPAIEFISRKASGPDSGRVCPYRKLSISLKKNEVKELWGANHSVCRSTIDWLAGKTGNASASRASRINRRCQHPERRRFPENVVHGSQEVQYEA